MNMVQCGACWIDVRIKAADLDPKRTRIICCDTGSRSVSAAFLLGERDFDVRVLQGGRWRCGHVLPRPPGPKITRPGV